MLKHDLVVAEGEGLEVTKHLQDIHRIMNEKRPKWDLGEVPFELTQPMEREGHAELPEATELTPKQKDQEMMHQLMAHRTEHAFLPLHRPGLSRVYAPVVQIYGVDEDKLRMGESHLLEREGSSIPTDKLIQPFCSCCHAPKLIPCCAILPCCDEPEYIVWKREISKYILIRENSIEWNEPSCVPASGMCCGISLCWYDITDNVKILYYDDARLKNGRISTPGAPKCCNDARIFCCGGRGELVRIDSPLCYKSYLEGMCVRGSMPCPFIPCCLAGICPCANHYNIYVAPTGGNYLGLDKDNWRNDTEEGKSRPRQQISRDLLKWGGAEQAKLLLEEARNRNNKRLDKKHFEGEDAGDKDSRVVQIPSSTDVVSRQRSRRTSTTM